MYMTKRKRRKFRYDRLFIVLISFVLFILLTSITKTFIYNKIVVSNSNKHNILVLKTKHNTVNLYKSTISTIKKNKNQIKIKNKDISILMNSNNFKNNMNFKYNTYIKKISNSNFNNSNAYYIDSNSIIKNSKKLSIKLPKFLRKYKIVDIYGIDNKNNIVPIKKESKVNNKHVTFKLSNYKKYLITYVKVKSINISKNIETSQNGIVNFNIKYKPILSTNKSITYTNIGDNFVIRDDKLIAKKTGTHTVTIKVNDTNIKKEVKVKVNKIDYEVEKKDGIYYIDGIMLVNKSYPISKDYDPKDLLDVTKKAYEKMKKDALKDDILLWIVSGYRDYKTQETIYNNYVAANGKEKADTFSARPGYSEHQTGYVMDLNDASSNFNDTRAAKWLDKNSYKYGFIIRYPKGKEKYTGYKYEPWHLRYVGKEKAEKLYKSGLSIEEYYNLTSKYRD